MTTSVILSNKISTEVESGTLLLDFAHSSSDVREAFLCAVEKKSNQLTTVVKHALEKVSQLEAVAQQSQNPELVHRIGEKVQEALQDISMWRAALPNAPVEDLSLFQPVVEFGDRLLDLHKIVCCSLLESV